MFPRILSLFVLVLTSMVPLNFGFRMVSAANNMQVIVGVVTLLSLVVAWFYVGRNYFRYFQKQFSDDSVSPTTVRGGVRYQAPCDCAHTTW